MVFGVGAAVPVDNLATMDQGSAPLANGQRTKAHGASPWRFTGGTINRVTADVSGETYPDFELELAALMSAQ